MLNENYKKIKAISQSYLKLYRDDTYKFYDEYVLGNEKKREDESISMLIGTLVDFGIFTCEGNLQLFDQHIDKYFCIYTMGETTSQVHILTNYLFEELQNINYLQNINFKDNRFIESFKVALERIQAEDKYKRKSVDAGLEDFFKKGLDYFTFKINNYQKKVINLSLIEKAKKIITTLKEDSFTKDIFDFSKKGKIIHPQIQWEFIFPNKDIIPCKQELDLIYIDEEKKEIHLYDLKCTYDNLDFEYSYIKFSYYIQNAFYYLGVKYWLHKNKMTDYKIINGMNFIVADTSKNKKRPIIYTTSIEDVKKGINGFKINNKYYRGVNELMTDLNWALNTDIFNVTRTQFLNKGKIPLNINYC
jgi:hypothetical protein